MFFDWTKVCYTLSLNTLKVDLDIARFVLELTENLWLYRYHIIRRWLFVIDRLFGITSIVVLSCINYDLTPRWPGYVCLGIYIVLHLISFALYSNTLLCKCYAFWTVISTVISSLFCTAAFNITLRMIRPDKTTIPFVVALIIVFCSCYICVIVWVFRKLKFVDDDPLQFLPEIKNNRWLIRYRKTRTYLMFVDRLLDIFAAYINVFYYDVSAPYRHVCLGVYITLRLISLALYSNTKLCECYAVRTVIPLIISGLFCSVSLSIPDVLTPGAEYLGYSCLILYTLIYLMISLLFFYKGN